MLNKSLLVSFLILTVCDLQQGFGNNTAGDVESLAAIEAAIGVLYIGNGQTTRLGDRESAKGLRRLVGEEETLERRYRAESEMHSLILVIHCDSRLQGQSHFTSFLLPEDCRLRIASGFTLEGDNSAHSCRLVSGA